MSQHETIHAAVPKVLILQCEHEQLHETIADQGYTVVKHTDHPFPWLDELENTLAVDIVLVSPMLLAFDDERAADLIRVTEMLQTMLYVDADQWVPLEVDA